ncbi:conserved hypothetical protein [Chloroherpeton thalassium ATCC 35110]|uniref:Uncharacterized protein n=1 Tax=Chloroherpeton thalassium (strain ATCC 35110 / GB-78) TaxID=517418 RepID=B3QY81_CHLT3|nr:hypothetical protein [Chloroherpeton thalassium]ACF15047.1 conserved hypothetical protein [Chloroherpeton thalassium ATCC 35110]
MKTKIHGIAGMVALLTISTFWMSTILVELFGSHDAIALVKRLIIWGMCLLIPSLIATGISGGLLGKENKSELSRRKMKRMPIIALNGLFILLPSAIVLNYLASNGAYSNTFYLVQSLELIAGAVNLFLITANTKDGFQLTKHPTNS